MEDLIKIVKMESIRTIVWVAIAMAIAVGLYYLVW